MAIDLDRRGSDDRVARRRRRLCSQTGPHISIPGHYGRIAFPQPVIIAMWLSGIAGPLLAFGLSRRENRRGIYAGVAIVWHAVAIALASSLPGTAFLLLIPAIGFTVRLPAVFSGVILFPLALFLYTALGKTGLVAIAIIIALVTATVAPLLRRSWRAAGAIAVVAIITASISPMLPLFTEDHPRRQAVEHELASPTVEATMERAGDVATIRVQSKRNADRIMLELDQRTITVYAPQAVIKTRVPEGTEIVVSDLTYGLPPEARERAAQRDASNGVTTHRGDVTISRRKIRI